MLYTQVVCQLPKTDKIYTIIVDTLIPMKLIADKKYYEVATIHGVCTAEEHRRNGYFRELMKEVMAYINTNFDFSILFTEDKTFLYEEFGYQLIPEYDFEIKKSKASIGHEEIKKLDLNNPSDVSLIHETTYERIPVSNKLGVIADKTVFTFFALDNDLYFSEQKRFLISLTHKNDTVYINDIVSKVNIEFSDIIESLPGPFSKIVFRFNPDRFYTDAIPIEADVECKLMATGNQLNNIKNIRYPNSARC